jgi:hypothetical protein
MKSGNKAFVWLFLFLILASLLLLVAFRAPAADPWEAVQNRISRLKTETQFRKTPRSELQVKLVPGNAWQEYEPAIDTMLKGRDDENGGIYSLFASNNNAVDRKKVMKLVAERKDVLEHLRLAAQRADGQYNYNWDAGPYETLPSLLGSRKLANLAIARAHLLTEEGKTQEAANLLLDASVFGRNLSGNAPLLMDLIGAAVYETAFLQMGRLVASGKLSKDQLKEFAGKLEIVEHDMPGIHTPLANETLLFGITEIQLFDAGGKEWLQLVKNDWGMLFSPRSRLAAAFEERDSFLTRAEKLDEMSFVDAKKEAAAIDAAAKISPNFLIRVGSPEISRILVVHRATLTYLRVVRAAALYLANGEMPKIQDPFGDTLLFKEDAGKTKIWSIGADGKSQGGAGSWGDEKPDITIEVPSYRR